VAGAVALSGATPDVAQAEWVHFRSVVVERTPSAAASTWGCPSTARSRKGGFRGHSAADGRRDVVAGGCHR
jgi:hypothetical protein